MKIEIDFNDDKFLVVLSRWASLRRTFKSAIDACEEAEESSASDIEKQRYDVCREELEALIDPLEYLHIKIRQVMWEKMCGSSLRKMHGFGNDIVCRLEKGHEGACRGC